MSSDFRHIQNNKGYKVMRKFISVALIFCMLISVFLLGGCSFTKDKTDEDEEIINNIIEASINNDVDALYNMFCGRAQTEDAELRQQVQDFAEYLQGDYISHVVIDSKSGDSNSAEGRRSYSRKGYKVTTSENVYYILCLNYSKGYTEDEIGIASLGIGILEYVEEGHSMKPSFLGAYVVSPESAQEEEGADEKED